MAEAFVTMLRQILQDLMFFQPGIHLPRHYKYIIGVVKNNKPKTFKAIKNIQNSNTISTKALLKYALDIQYKLKCITHKTPFDLTNWYFTLKNAQFLKKFNRPNLNVFLT